jgi:hypothetical protein
MSRSRRHVQGMLNMMHLQKPVMVSFVLAVLIGFCGPAFAHCAANEETVIDCAIGDKRLSLCVASDATLIYSFENNKTIELRLVDGPRAYQFRPWPGIGRTIWENVTFTRGPFAYQVYSSFDKMSHETQSGVSVLRGDTEIASLSCDEDAGAFPFDPVSDALTRAGYCALEDGVRVQGGCE